MGLLRRGFFEEEPDSAGAEEEAYERLFSKVGRDFVYREDFFRIIRKILEIVDPAGAHPIDIKDNSEARRKALIYKGYLDSGIDGSAFFKDLINLDED